MITITIKTDNAAFGDRPSERSNEVARILRGLANKIDSRGYGCAPAGVYDINGNKVGSVVLTGKDRGL